MYVMVLTSAFVFNLQSSQSKVPDYQSLENRCLFECFAKNHNNVILSMDTIYMYINFADSE